MVGSLRQALVVLCHYLEQSGIVNVPIRDYVLLPTPLARHTVSLLPLAAVLYRYSLPPLTAVLCRYSHWSPYCVVTLTGRHIVPLPPLAAVLCRRYPYWPPYSVVTPLPAVQCRYPTP